MQQLVFIASLEHSGSTLLNLMLGGHSRFIGLGEIARVIRPGSMKEMSTRQSVCSCGKTLHQCSFWGNVASQIPDDDSLNFEEKYTKVLELFERTFGPEYIPVDSSKYPQFLQKILEGKPQLNLKVLYLIKDVRSFTVSRLDNSRRKGQGGWEANLRKNPVYIFWWWYRKNKQMQRLFEHYKLSVLQMGYEELCLYPKQLLQNICEFLGQDMEPSMLSLENSHSHVIRGNRMRSQKEKAEILYDHRWFFRREWMLPAVLFPNIMRYNAREVYRNNTDVIWKK